MSIWILDDVIPEHLQDYFELSILGKSGDKQMHPTVSSDELCAFIKIVTHAIRTLA